MRRILSPGRLLVAGLVLLAVVLGVLWLAPARSHYLYLPDPAHPVAPLVTVEGERPRQGRGGIFFVDVRYRRARLLERLFPGLQDGSSLVHVSEHRERGLSEEAQRRRDLHAMAVSQRVAAAVALRELGYRVTGTPRGAFVVGVERDAPARRVLRGGDVIVAVDGERVATVGALRRRLERRRPGERVRLRIRRGRSERDLTVRTIADREDRSRALVGIRAVDDVKLRIPLKVRIDARGVGGPSAGLAFALDIVDELGRDVDRGRKVAATGALSLDGSVDQIGGVKQKTLGARAAGVDVFVVPAGKNAREARRYAQGLRILPVKSFQHALRALATSPGHR